MNRLSTGVVAGLILALGVGIANTAFAHCDGMDGPVVNAAKEALETGNVNLVLIWVQKKDEAKIRTAFEKTQAVRKLGSEARDLADRYFFETVVRLHRAGEGAPFTGLKPPGRDLGPAIPAADRAIEQGTQEQVQHLLTRAIHEGIADRFEDVLAKKSFDPRNIEAGREYVKAYVAFVHYVEGLHQAASNQVRGHHEEGKLTETGEHR